MLVENWTSFINKQKLTYKLEEKVGENFDTQNYLEKFKYVCIDFDNIYKKSINDITMQDIICAIVNMDWAIECTKVIEKELSKVLSISFDKFNKYKSLKELSESIRSFVIAHPLETNRHSKYDLDGRYICIDIQPQKDPFILNSHYKWFSINGLNNKPKSNKTYCYIKCYSTKIQSNFFYFGICLNDIYEVIKYCIKRLDYFNKTIKQIK